MNLKIIRITKSTIKKTMVCYGKIDPKSIYQVLKHYGLALHQVAKRSEIPYSFWGSPEAGRRNNQLYIRFDTPVHSILHETCHFVCMPKMRRFLSYIDAAGDVMEENATCYLQILLSGYIEGFHRTLHMADMDDWGYSFRLDAAAAWFHEDAKDAKSWLENHTIIDKYSNITWKLRE